MLKTITFVTLCLLLTPLSIKAQSEEQADWKEGYSDPCFAYSDMAKHLMNGRQSGASIKMILERLDKKAILLKLSPSEKEKFAYIIREAFTVPYYKDESAKETAATEFEAKIYLWCLNEN